MTIFFFFCFFIFIFIFQIEEQSFQDCIWPVLEGRIKPLNELSLEMLHFVLLVRVLYPHVVKKKFLLSHIGTPEVIHEDSIQTCAKLLMVSGFFYLIWTSGQLAYVLLFLPPSIALPACFLYPWSYDGSEMVMALVCGQISIVCSEWSLDENVTCRPIHYSCIYF